MSYRRQAPENSRLTSVFEGGRRQSQQTIAAGIHRKIII
jgi:hypothetical protein